MRARLGSNASDFSSLLEFNNGELNEDLGSFKSWSSDDDFNLGELPLTDRYLSMKK